MKKNWRKLTAILLASAMIATTGGSISFAEGETNEIVQEAAIGETKNENNESEDNGQKTEEEKTENNDEITEENKTENNDEVTDKNKTENNDEVTEENKTENNDEVTEENKTENNDEVTDENKTENNDEVTDENKTENNDEVTDENKTENNDEVTDENKTENNDEVTDENKTEAAPADDQQNGEEQPENEETANLASEDNTLKANARYVNTYDYRQEVIRLVNIERANKSLPALKEDANLAKAASLRASEIVENQSHTRPNGSDCFTAIENMSDYRAFGENIAYGQKTPAEVVKDWMNSPGHRANILDEKKHGFNVIGVGCYEYNNILYWTQFFAATGSNISSKPVPTQVGKGTATMSFGQTLDDITDKVTGISFVDSFGTETEGTWSWVQGNQKLDVGTHEVQIVFKPDLVALFSTTGIVTVTVVKGSTTIPTIPAQQVMPGDTETKYFNLSTLLSTEGGTWTYQLGKITDTDNILNTPMIGTNKVLAYSVKAGAKPGQTAAISIIASNKNSNDITLTVPISILSETYTCTLSRIPEKVIVGEDIDLTGITITTKYGSGKPSDTVAVTAAMLKGYDKTLTGSAALGQKTITVMPDSNNPNRTATFSIKVEDVITDLKVTAPGKSKYNKGDNIDLTYGTVQVVRKSGVPSLEIPLEQPMLNVKSVLDKVGTIVISVTTDGGTGLAPFTKENAFEITVKGKFSSENVNFSMDIDLVGADGGPLTKKDVDLYMSGVDEKDKEATRKKVQELAEGKKSAHAVDISLITTDSGEKKAQIKSGTITITINYSDIGMNPEDTNLMVYHYAQGVWENLSGITRGSSSFTLSADSLSPFVFCWDSQGSNPTTPTTPGSSSSSSNKGSSSGGSSSSSKSGTSIFNGMTNTINSILKSKLAGNSTASTVVPVTGNTNAVTASPLTQAAAQTAFNQAVSFAKSKGIKEANIHLQNISVVSAEILNRFVSDMQKSGLQGVLTADFVKNGVVEIRFSIPVSAAANLKKDFNLSLKQGGNQVRANFEKYYRNRTEVIPLAQEGSFGVPVSVAARISLPNTKAEDLYFYSYNPATNTYQQLPQSKVFFDVNGYLHFATEEGNYIVISDGALQRK